MRRRAAQSGIVVAAAALLALGLAGAYGYAQDYSLHRGFATLVHFRRAGRGRLETVHFYSPALGRRADYLIYLPPHYSFRRRLPVFYLLHGAPGQPRVFVDIANMDVRLDNQLSIGRARPMLLVYPDGRIGGSTFSDSEWANTSRGRFESYVIDVMHNVDARFATIPRRQDRVIGGFSAGAYGAMNVALHHLSDFANVQSWSGYFTQTRTGVFAGASRANLSYNSPLAYVARLRHALVRYPLRVYMYTGRADGASAQLGSMVRALLSAGAHVSDRLFPGGHDWSVWYPRLNQMLDLAARDVAHPPSTGGRAGPAPSPAPTPQPAVPRARRRGSELGLIGALFLTLISAALINLGFVLQHRGHARARVGERTSLTRGFRQPTWLIGQAVGWIGFGGQIVAVALAPLTLVQAFSSGSLALSVPLAARLCGHRMRRRQLLPIGLIAISLASLPVGFGFRHGHLRPGLLLGAALVVSLAAMFSARRNAMTLAVTAGAFYGLADAAIKAASITLRFHGGGIFTGWSVMAALCTLAGFLAFQAALQTGEPVGPLSLMNAFAALTAVGLGVVAFGERLGASAAATALHGMAIAAVLACVRPLTGAQQELLAPAGTPLRTVAPPTERFRSMGYRDGLVRILSRKFVTGAAVFLAPVAALGLIYWSRLLGILNGGPRVSDALSLLQLAGFDAQPLARLLLPAVLLGLVLGGALTGIERPRRIVSMGAVALLLLLMASDASYALTRNLTSGWVLLNHAPGLGPWLEAVVLTAAGALPGPLPHPDLRGKLRRMPRRGALAPAAVATLGAITVIVLLTPSGPARAKVSSPSAPAVAATNASPGRTTSPAAPAGPALQRRLDWILRRAAAQIHAPALTAALVRCGRTVWTDAIGRLAVGLPRRATDRTLFVLNSAAKTFVATMIMQEVEAGRLSLHTRLSRFYPGLPNAGQITVRMLLSMTSGLPDYLNNPRIAWTLAHRPKHHWTIRQVLTGLGTGLGRPRFLPGRGFAYSDTNYIVLGGILERITGSSVERDLQRLIVRPLGLAAATFEQSLASLARAAHPYLLYRSGQLSSRWLPGFGVSTGVWGPVFTDGGLATSSVDLARFANALLAGRLVNAAAVREMTRIGQGDYGFGIRGHPLDGHVWLGHRGYFGGYEAEDWSNPGNQLTFAAGTNVQPVGTGPVLDPIWAAIARAYHRANPHPARCEPAWPVSGPRRS